MKIAFYLLLAVVWFAYLSEPTISFKPFSVEFGKPFLPFAWLFLIISLTLFDLQSHKIAYKKGVEDAVEVVKEVLNEKNK